MDVELTVVSEPARSDLIRLSDQLALLEDATVNLVNACDTINKALLSLIARVEILEQRVHAQRELN